MTATKRIASQASATAELQLASFIEKFDTKNAALIRSVRKALRKRLPSANELVYDNYNALVIGFGPNERASDAIFSIVLYPRYIVLFFLQGQVCLIPISAFKAAEASRVMSGWKPPQLWTILKSLR